jgi:hypothetical protein
MIVESLDNIFISIIRSKKYFPPRLYKASPWYRQIYDHDMEQTAKSTRF